MSLYQPEITESRPKSLQGLLGGIGIALSVHSLLVLNGSVLGVSAFVHHSLRGDKAAMASVVGLILGGIAVGIIGDVDTPVPHTSSLLFRMVFSGLLVGIGTKVCLAFFPKVSSFIVQLVHS
jgi:zinc transporter ZupT